MKQIPGERETRFTLEEKVARTRQELEDDPPAPPEPKTESGPGPSWIRLLLLASAGQSSVMVLIFLSTLDLEQDPPLHWFLLAAWTTTAPVWIWSAGTILWVKLPPRQFHPATPKEILEMTPSAVLMVAMAFTAATAPHTPPLLLTTGLAAAILATAAALHRIALKARETPATEDR